MADPRRHGEPVLGRVKAKSLSARDSYVGFKNRQSPDRSELQARQSRSPVQGSDSGCHSGCDCWLCGIAILRPQMPVPAIISPPRLYLPFLSRLPSRLDDRDLSSTRKRRTVEFNRWSERLKIPRAVCSSLVTTLLGADWRRSKQDAHTLIPIANCHQRKNPIIIPRSSRTCSMPARSCGDQG